MLAFSPFIQHVTKGSMNPESGPSVLKLKPKQGNTFTTTMCDTGFMRWGCNCFRLNTCTTFYGTEGILILKCALHCRRSPSV